jgi:hypothetical protein
MALWLPMERPPSDPPARIPPAPVSAPAPQRVVHRPGFWEGPFAQNVLPLLGSVGFHGLLFVLVLLTIRAITQYVDDTDQRQIIIPFAELAEAGPPGGIPHPGLGDDPTRDAARDRFPELASRDGLAERPGPSLSASLLEGRASAVESALIGVRPGDAADSGLSGGNRSGLLAPFGVPGGGGGIGPRSSFIGLGGNAYRIAYVCDASGSMLSLFDALKIELRRSIDALRPVQSFNVIFFQEQGFAAADKTALLPATRQSKDQVWEFVSRMFVRGQTNPVPALDAAFKQNPELIYLLTDGDFNSPGNDAVVKYCADRTRDGKVKINTIAFVPDGMKDNPLAMEWVRALKQIAENSGGQFRAVTNADLER